MMAFSYPTLTALKGPMAAKSDSERTFLKRTLPKDNKEMMLRWWRQQAENGSKAINEHSGVERPRLGECLDVLVPQNALESNSPLYPFPV
ncbi:hypothetical protein LINGRAHAP2_LOCUS4662 [Linum grandiflorum]